MQSRARACGAGPRRRGCLPRPEGLTTFSEQPTILFVPLECRYVTAAPVPQLQSEASATRLPQTMSEGVGEGGWDGVYVGEERGRV